jgi:TolB protein
MTNTPPRVRTNRSRPSRRLTLAASAAALSAGLLAVAGAQPAPATRPSERVAPPATAPASAPPATGPVTPDPREAAVLTSVTQLTRGFDRAGEGYFSADMKWVVFQATPKGEKEYQMYVARLHAFDGIKPFLSQPVRVSPPNSRNTCGYFSPDGKTLIFGSTAGKEKPDELSAGYQRQGGNYRWAFPDGMEIYAAKDWQAASEFAVQANAIDFATAVTKATDGTQPPSAPDVPLMVPKPIDLATPANRLTNNDAYDAEGSFSPDGKWICFTSRRSGDTDVWVMKADGSNPVQITTAKGYDGGPFFAPDGKRLLYRSDRKGNDLLQVFVADLAFDAAGNITGSKTEHQLTDDANVNWGPFFHPDNKHIVYATSAHGHANYELYLMRDDGSAKTRITYCAGFDGLPVFSPDGKFLMWSSKRAPDNTTQLFIGKYKAPADEASLNK